MNEIFCKIAGLTFRLCAAPPLNFSAASGGEITEPDHFRGFEIKRNATIDYNIIVCDIEQNSADEFCSCATFCSQRTGDGDFEHLWQLQLSTNGQQRISAEFFNHPLLSYADLTLSAGGQCVMRLRRINKSQTLVPAYIYPIVNITLSRMLLNVNGFLVHSSVVDDGGKGYLFTAVSGTGKSTMARLWESCGAAVINDDMNAITPSASGDYIAHSIPMPHYVRTPRRAKLSAIFIISQSKENFITPITGAEKVMSLIVNTITQNIDPHTATTHLQNVAAACAKLPVFSLGFRPDTDVVKLIRSLDI